MKLKSDVATCHANRAAISAPERLRRLTWCYAYLERKTVNEIGTEVARLAGLALDSFQDRAGGRLDFSERSLKVVEEMLAETAEWRHKLEDGQIVALVQKFGCYILETARAEFGGTYAWHAERDQPVLVVGEPDFHVAILAWEKVKGRINGEAADNIPFFYAGFAGRARNAMPGTRVLCV